VSQTTQQTTVAPGKVARLSVAVAVNQTLTPTQQQAIQQMVTAAIGADPTRQDQITVVGMLFAATATGLVSAPTTTAAKTSPVLPMALAGVAALAVITALVLTVLGGGSKEEVAAMAEQRLAEQLVGRTAVPNGSDAPEQPDMPPDLDLLDETSDPNAVRRAARAETEQRRREIVSVVQRRPEDVANVLRSWLTEEQG